MGVSQPDPGIHRLTQTLEIVVFSLQTSIAVPPLLIAMAGSRGPAAVAPTETGEVQPVAAVYALDLRIDPDSPNCFHTTKAFPALSPPKASSEGFDSRLSMTRAPVQTPN